MRILLRPTGFNAWKRLSELFRGLLFLHAKANSSLHFKASKQTNSHKQIKSQEKVQAKFVAHPSLLLRRDCQPSYLHDEQPLFIILYQVWSYPLQTNVNTLQMQWSHLWICEHLLSYMILVVFPHNPNCEPFFLYSTGLNDVSSSDISYKYFYKKSSIISSQNKMKEQ